MNENDINVLLDHFVGALDSSESASVTNKINTLPVWSETYKQINLIFGGLNSIKEEDSKQLAPEGLASKTILKILEQKKSQQSSTEFIAQKPSSSEQIVRPTTHKRPVSIKPSVLVFSACAGFLFVVALTFSTSFLGSSINTNPKSSMDLASTVTPSNNPTDFAVTGSFQQPMSGMIWCSETVSDPANQIPYSNDFNSFSVNAPEQLVDLSGSSVPSVTTVPPVTAGRLAPVNMACPDNSFVVLLSRSEGRPIILVQPRNFPGELKNIQNVFNQQNDNFAIPVNYQK